MRLFLALVAVAACLAGTIAIGQMPTRLQVPGCEGVSNRYQDIGSRHVLWIKARECHPTDDAGSEELLGAHAAIDRLAEAGWRARTPPFDSIYVAVYRVAELPGPCMPMCAREVSHDELVTRWGPRPDSLNTRPPADRTPVYLALGFVSALICALLFIGLVQAMRSGRVIMIWMR